MRSTIGISIAAPPSRVFELARDICRWPELLPHYRRVTVQARRGDRVVAQMVAVRRFGPLPVPVTWRAEQWADASDPDDLRLHFRHIRGVTRGMVVTWRIRPAMADGGPVTGARADAAVAVAQADAADVTIEHEFTRRLPLLGDRLLPQLVDRLFTRPIAGRTLATFKRLAES